MFASRTVLGPIKGVARSAIGQALPTITGQPCFVLDLGANVDCTARHLCQFAEMGMVYAERVLGIQTPRVGILNIGEEQAKGNEIAKVVHRSLSAFKHINFIGNIEPKMLYKGMADVVVCDGFIGNLVLKTSEAVGTMMNTLLKQHLKSGYISQIGALLAMGAFKRLKKTVDPNEHAGAPLLGVNGTVIICHGASSARGHRQLHLWRLQGRGDLRQRSHRGGHPGIARVRGPDGVVGRQRRVAASRVLPAES